MTTTAIVSACLSISFFIYGSIKFIVAVIEHVVRRKDYDVTGEYLYIVIGAIGFFLSLVL